MKTLPPPRHSHLPSHQCLVSSSGGASADPGLTRGSPPYCTPSQPLHLHEGQVHIFPSTEQPVMGGLNLALTPACTSCRLCKCSLQGARTSLKSGREQPGFKVCCPS
jgi:hypothetical protein